MNILETTAIGLFLVVAAVKASRLRRQYGLRRDLFVVLIAEHVLSTLYYISLDGDWKTYLSDGTYLARINSDFGYVRPGTKIITGLTHLIMSAGDFGAYHVFAVFSTIGFFGVLFYSLSVQQVTNNPSSRWMLLPLMPSVHLWSVALGKDALVFAAITYVLWVAARESVSAKRLLVPIVMIAFVRPHVAVLLVASLALAATFSRGVPGDFRRWTIPAATGLSLFVLIPLALSIGKIENASAQSVLERIELSATKNQGGGSSVDISRYSPPLRMLTYLFRPLFFDASGAVKILASIENVILLVLSTTILRYKFLAFVFVGRRFSVLLAMFFVLTAWFMLGMSTANLGIAMRQKMQFVPYLLLLVVHFNVWVRTSGRGHEINPRRLVWLA